MAQAALLGPHLLGHGLERLQTVHGDDADLVEGVSLIVVLGPELERVAQCAPQKVQFDAQVLEVRGGVLLVAQLDCYALEEAEDGDDLARGGHLVSEVGRGLGSFWF